VGHVSVRRRSGTQRAASLRMGYARKKPKLPEACFSGNRRHADGHEIGQGRRISLSDFSIDMLRWLLNRGVGGSL